MNARATERASRARLWGAIAAPLTAWSVQVLASPLVTYEGCIWGKASLARTLLVVLAVLCIAVAVVSGAVASRALHRVGEPHEPSEEPREQDAMLALVGVLMAVATCVGIVWNGLSPVLLSHICEVIR